MMETRINADFEQRVVIRPEEYQWKKSPMPGVDRMMLDRIGDEVARATTIVRYEPNSEFSAHVHSGGEEFYVLEGVFADEHGDYPVGTYARNPIGTAHTPKIGDEGATIFVKLQQFDEQDNKQFSINTAQHTWQQGTVEGVSIMPLHKFEEEHVTLEKWQANTHSSEQHNSSGKEILVLEGTLYDEHGEYPKGTWIRNPRQSTHTPFTKEDGALIYVKVGHL